MMQDNRHDIVYVYEVDLLESIPDVQLLRLHDSTF